MGLVIGIVAIAITTVLLIWVIRNPGPETSMGAESKARREAKRQARRNREDQPGNRSRGQSDS